MVLLYDSLKLDIDFRNLLNLYVISLNIDIFNQILSHIPDVPENKSHGVRYIERSFV